MIEEIFDFYEIDIDYVRYLYNYDHQIFYNEQDENYDKKPYIGIVVVFDKYKYFVPLTSAKEKHKRLKNVGRTHMLIYEFLKRKNICEDTDIFKVIKEDENGNIDEDEVKKIYSLIDFEKAIPVSTGFYHKIEIVGNVNQDLLQKEFNFCINKKSIIIKKAISTIKEQHNTGIIAQGQCNYSVLENACETWALGNLRINTKENHKGKINSINSKNLTNDLLKLVEIENGIFSRFESLNPNNLKMQYVKIYAKDEFGHEKHVEVMIQIEERTPAKTK